MIRDSRQLIHTELYHAILKMRGAFGQTPQPWLLPYVAMLAGMLGLSLREALWIGDAGGDNDVADLVYHRTAYDLATA